MKVPIPSAVSSGNITPQSITIARPAHSIAIRLRPISPSPPSATIRTGAVVEVLAAIALSCLRTEANYIGQKTAAKAAVQPTTPCLENGAELVFGHEVEKMAASVNKVILIGNLGRDPETRFTNSGTSVTNFSIATTEQFADKAGARQERTEWHNIIVWGKQGE